MDGMFFLHTIRLKNSHLAADRATGRGTPRTICSMSPETMPLAARLSIAWRACSGFETRGRASGFLREGILIEWLIIDDGKAALESSLHELCRPLRRRSGLRRCRARRSNTGRRARLLWQFLTYCATRNVRSPRSSTFLFP